MKKIKLKDGIFISDKENSSELYELIGLTAPINYDKCSLALTKLGSNAQITRHTHHKSEEIYVFISGSAMMKINDSEFEVSEGSTVMIHANDIHEMHTGVDEMVEFYAITIPPYKLDDFIVV